MAHYDDVDADDRALAGGALRGKPVVVTQHTGASGKRDDDDPWLLSPQREAMADGWALPSTLMGGTRAMRDAGRMYLPQEPAEEEEAYATRLGRSILFNGFRDTVQKLSGKPFSRDVKLKPETSAELEALEKDVDLRGQTLTQFANQLLEHAWQYGLAHVFVEYPDAPPGLTLAQERDLGLRPYLVEILATDVLGWRSAFVNGVEVLTQLRRRECTVEASGRFGSREVERVRVYNRVEEVDGDGKPTGVVVTWDLYERDEQDKPKVVASGRLTLGEIPLVTLYVRRKGMLTAEPPLEDLAWLNLAHWQSSSDQRNILRIARVGIMFAAGVSDEELGRRIPVGPSILLTAAKPDAKMGWVEHEGRAIAAGRQDLLDLREEMELMGLEPLLHRPGGTPTATQEVLDTAKANSSLRKSVTALKQVLEAALLIAGRWLNLQNPVAAVDVSDDFGLTIGQSADAERLITMRKNREITRDTLWSELKRRNVLSEDFDAVAEAAALEKEAKEAAAVAAEIGAGGKPGDEDDDPDAEDPREGENDPE